MLWYSSTEMCTKVQCNLSYASLSLLASILTPQEIWPCFLYIPSMICTYERLRMRAERVGRITHEWSHKYKGLVWHIFMEFQELVQRLGGVWVKHTEADMLEGLMCKATCFSLASKLVMEYEAGDYLYFHPFHHATKANFWAVLLPGHKQTCDLQLLTSYLRGIVDNKWTKFGQWASWFPNDTWRCHCKARKC